MAGNIKFSPEQGRDMAQEIISRRDAIQGELDSLSGLISGELCAQWEGSASRQYSEQYEQLKSSVMANFLTMLEELSAQLNSIVEAMEAADEDIASKIKMV
ncbi:WXG100 family type VII secretion target [Clostridium paraputrificum]|uniref:WXG100 family type VII secretion target n=1 Tax=Clostridium paraputrificum TaxID=29363 RepID=UPI003D33ACD5